ncbi:MAG TPA: NAD-dependent succinate-semialdehyde dehydrogenase [Verrucomicrobiae bacterium]|nr:NAD-dependent succinate-semialdehyde dehydrogenase [Verrucomicrobiae bacterium]
MSAFAAERARLALSRPDLLRERAFIGGAWVESARQIAVHNPATGQAFAQVPDLGAAETLRAVDAAENAFPNWAAHTGKERAARLRAWFDLVLKHQEDLARLMTAEQGKPLSEARGEIAYAAGFIEWFAEEAKRSYGDVIPGHTRSTRIWVEKRPHGIVAAVTPWNFPAAMITRKVAPALAAGCSVVLKPSELTPLSALALAALAEEAGIPAGVFNVVTGAPAAIGDVLVSDPRIAKFTFTGSTNVGKTLAARCMDSVKRVSLELGGNAPFVVCADADLDAAVRGAIASKFRNTGQTCVCANRFLVHTDIYDAFCDALAAQTQQLIAGDGLAGETTQGPLIDARALAKVETHVADALNGGARVLAGGGAHDLGGTFYRASVLADVAPDALLCREETFGPVAGIVRVRDDSEAIRLANATRAGLAAYLFSRDFDRAHTLSSSLHYGMVGLNTGLISTELAPFGGCKESGIGREGSKYGMAEFQDMRTTCAEIAAPS